MRNPDIVCETVRTTGGAQQFSTDPTAATLTSMKRNGASMLPESRHRPAGPGRTTLEPCGIAEVNLHVNGFSILVRVFPDGASTKKSSDLIATHIDIESILSSAFEMIVDRLRGADRPTANLSSPGPRLRSSGELVTVSQAAPQPTVLRVGPLELNLLERTAKRSDRQIELLPREYRLLRYMMERCNKLLTRARLLQEVWNYKFVSQTNLVDVHMSRLRRKVDGVNEPPMIHSVRGAGFVLNANPPSRD